MGAKLSDYAAYEMLDRKVIEKYMKMSSEERHKAMEREQKRWNSLTEEEKDKECFDVEVDDD